MQVAVFSDGVKNRTDNSMRFIIMWNVSGGLFDGCHKTKLIICGWFTEVKTVCACIYVCVCVGGEW